jgi:hypothetical protein
LSNEARKQGRDDDYLAALRKWIMAEADHVVSADLIFKLHPISDRSDTSGTFLWPYFGRVFAEWQELLGSDHDRGIKVLARFLDVVIAFFAPEESLNVLYWFGTHLCPIRARVALDAYDRVLPLQDPPLSTRLHILSWSAWVSFGLGQADRCMSYLALARLVTPTEAENFIDLWMADSTASMLAVAFSQRAREEGLHGAFSNYFAGLFYEMGGRNLREAAEHYLLAYYLAQGMIFLKDAERTIRLISANDIDAANNRVSGAYKRRNLCRIRLDQELIEDLQKEIDKLPNSVKDQIHPDMLATAKDAIARRRNPT